MYLYCYVYVFLLWVYVFLLLCMCFFSLIVLFRVLYVCKCVLTMATGFTTRCS